MFLMFLYYFDRIGITEYQIAEWYAWLKNGESRSFIYSQFLIFNNASK